MYKIVARLTVKKDKIDEFKKTAEELIKKSRAEAGNNFYTLNQLKDDEQKFAFIESWKDDNALEIHNASEHFKGIFPKLQELTEGEASIELYREYKVED